MTARAGGHSIVAKTSRRSFTEGFIHGSEIEGFGMLVATPVAGH
jgi:hypothetical protein